jgi:iron complex outermembrane receptor protein
MGVTSRLLVGAASVALLTGLAAAAAAAQPDTTPGSPQASPSGPASPQAAPQVQEIIVTAERREESLQKAPVSVTAVDSSKLEQLHVTNLAGLTDVAPNFSIQGVGAVTRSSAVVYTRGIGFQGSGGVAPPIGVSIDGMFYATNEGTLLNIFDVNRIEILEGPQGSLFGRNTIGGVVQIITNDPTHDFGVSGFIRGGNYGTIDSNVTANIPLSDTLAARISFNTQNSNGYYKNFYVDPDTGARPANEDTGNIDNKAARAKLKWTPNDSFTALLTGWYLTQRQDSPVGVNASGPTDAIYYAGLPDANADTHGRPGYGYPGGPTNVFVTHRYTNGADNLDETGTILDLTWRTPYGFDVKSISGFMHFNTLNIDDFSATDLNFFTSQIYYGQSQFSQELRLQSDANDSKLHWQTGVYYFTTNYFTRQANIIGPSFFDPDTNASSPTFTQYVGAKEYNFNVAGFGQLDYEIIPRLTLTVGARYTYEYTSVTDFPGLENLNPPYVPAIGGRDHWSDFTFHLGAHYNFTNDLMAYVSYSTGDQAGGFSTTAATQSQMTPYAPEEAHAFETGLRSQWFDRRLQFNLTGFWTTYGNLQVGAYRPAEGGSGQQAFIANAAFERARGVELEATALPVRGLLLSASVGYLDARYTSFIAALSYNFPGHACDGLSGGPGSPPIMQNHATPGTPCFLLPPFSPSLTANLSASYDLDLDRFGKLTPHVAWTAQTHYFTDLENAPQGFQTAWSEVDADLAYQPLSSHWRLSAFVKNLNNNLHLLNDNPIAGLFTVNYYADPRTYGLELSFKFK